MLPLHILGKKNLKQQMHIFTPSYGHMRNTVYRLECAQLVGAIQHRATKTEKIPVAAGSGEVQRGHSR